MRRRLQVAMALVATAALLVTGCGAAKKDPGTSSTTVREIPADAETQPMQHTGDSADDPTTRKLNRSPPAALRSARREARASASTTARPVT